MREKDNSVYITFPDPADVRKATSLLKQHADSARIFKSVSQLDVFFPAVALFVDVSDLERLKNELEHRNPSLKDKIHSLKAVNTRPNANIGLKLWVVQLFLFNFGLKSSSVLTNMDLEKRNLRRQLGMHLSRILNPVLMKRKSLPALSWISKVLLIPPGIQPSSLLF